MKKPWVWFAIFVGIVLLSFLFARFTRAHVDISPEMVCRWILVVSGMAILAARVVAKADLAGPAILILAGVGLGGDWVALLLMTVLVLSRLTLNFLREQQKPDA